MWNYDLANDGARMASTGAASEATCGISSRVDGGTAIPGKVILPVSTQDVIIILRRFSCRSHSLDMDSLIEFL